MSFTLLSLIKAGYITHLFGPAAEEVADALMAEATSAGWSGVSWAGGELFPDLVGQEVVRVSVRDRHFWMSVLPHIGVRIKRIHAVLLGVSGTEVVPTSWRHDSSVRVECQTPNIVKIVKTRFDDRQGYVYCKSADGTWNRQGSDV